MSEEQHSKTFRRLAYLEKLAKLARQLEQKREAMKLFVYLDSQITTHTFPQEMRELEAMMQEDSSLAKEVRMEQQQCDHDLRDLEVHSCLLSTLLPYCTVSIIFCVCSQAAIVTEMIPRDESDGNSAVLEVRAGLVKESFELYN